MSDKKNALRIDWFDGSVIVDSRSNPASSQFDDEEPPEASVDTKPKYTERKLMGFKRLLDLSQQDGSNLTLQLSGRSSFWDLLDSDLKDDYIVLIAKILARLFMHLRSNQKSIIMTNLLKTRFLTSKSINTLKIYMSQLPDTRITEKRMNMQFWDDIEPFYDSVVTICEGIIMISKDGEKAAKELFESCRGSTFGVMDEHKEQFSEELFLRMDEVEGKMSNLEFKDPSSLVANQNTLPKTDVSNNFKNLNIFPTRDDLLGKGPPSIEPNIVNGAYTSVAHYLDVQFKLLREDCFGPLREGISKYMENPAKRRHENIRVHPKVRIIRTYVSNNRVGYLLDLAWRERSAQSSVDSKKYAYNKQLMYGSLILLTSDNFDTILCATVLDSSISLLNDGYLAISFHTPVSKSVFSEAFLMIESEVFFEPYHRVLKVLQDSNEDDIPMKRYIVDVQKETKPPPYLTESTEYSIKNGNEEIFFPVLDTDNWPSNDVLGLDSSQADAYKLALTREFAVIQGPPGTGKTFIGVKVATTLLQNLSLLGTPMLVICYTNHALDQFLEGILKVTENVIRLGSQSKNPKIEPYTLNNWRMKSKSKHSYLYKEKRTEQEKIFKQMLEIQTDLERCDKEVLSYKNVKKHLNIELISGSEDAILSWLFEIRIPDENDEDDWEKQLDDVNDDGEITSCFSEELALKEVESMMNSIKYVNDVTSDDNEGESVRKRFEDQIGRTRQRLDCFKKYSKLYQNGDNKLRKVSSLYDYNTDERWKCYFNAVNQVKQGLIETMNGLQEKHYLCSEELEEIATLVDAEVVKTGRVVAATTSTAARRHDLLQNLRSSIVIVEEAAEVLEAHIVASLTHHCQHVILIGDHKQLRPTAAHYTLAKHKNLEISLFERMIQNGVHARTLSIQRRMRPVFVELIVPVVYEKLKSHDIVEKYQDVKGMRDNLFFFTHQVFEDEGIEDSWSHRNTFEARWCVSLANYLREMEYAADDVTILTTYTGQAALIKEMSRKYAKLRDTRITVVDNYQGEESRIVILSLVRSNRDGNIGFLKAQNRICVALSRAKEGFYIFGNMDSMKSASPIWSAINDRLIARRAIGKKLGLRCGKHNDNILEVGILEELETCLEGKCLKICK